MALAVNVIDRHGPSSEMGHQLRSKKIKVGCIIRLYSNKRRFTRASLLTRWSSLVLKVGVSYGWKMTKCVASYSQRILR